MSSNQKKSMIQVCVLVVFLSMIGTVGFGRYMNNLSEAAFDESLVAGSSLSGAMVQSSSMGTYIIQGAGYYLKAYSNSLLMANAVEMSDLNGVNFVELKGYITQAIANMELASDIYASLVNKANNTPYKTSWINLLMSFNYNTFETEKGLNQVVFNEVRSYLGNGDVRGVYAMMLTRVDAILGDLNDIKAVVEGNNLPRNEAVWRLNQRWSESLLFGQYVAEVFYRISEQ